MMNGLSDLEKKTFLFVILCFNVKYSTPIDDNYYCNSERAVFVQIIAVLLFKYADYDGLICTEGTNFDYIHWNSQWTGTGETIFEDHAKKISCSPRNMIMKYGSPI